MTLRSIVRLGFVGWWAVVALAGCVRVDQPPGELARAALDSTAHATSVAAAESTPVITAPAEQPPHASFERPVRSWLGADRTRALSAGDWAAAKQANPAIPTNVAELEALRSRIVNGASGSDSCADFDSDNMVCGTGDVSSFAVGLRNPALSAHDRQRLALPTAKAGSSVISTAHFNVYYTAGSKTGQVSKGIAQDAADDLEAAYTAYLGTFGVAIVPTGSKVTVNFSTAVNSTLPGGPITFTADYFKNNGLNRLARMATAYHEAFHLLQFVQGFTADAMYLWILESTATWAELQYASQGGVPSITGSRKLTYLWEHPNLEIFDSQRYVLLPFFLFLENLCANCPTNVLVSYFTAGVSTGNAPISALVSSVSRCTGGAYNDFGQLLTQFGARMAQGNWDRTPSGGQLYPTLFDASVVPPAPIVVPPLALPGTRYTLRSVGNAWLGSGSVPTASMAFFRFDFDLGAHSVDTWYDVATLGLYTGSYYSLFRYAATGATSGVGPVVSRNTGTISLSALSSQDPQSMYLVMSGGFSPATYGGKACFNTSATCP